jgi:hypothetical protein
MRRRNT